MRIMTKYKQGEKHQCDDTCKINHTTDFARKNKLPSGSKVRSTKESSDKAYKKQMAKVKKTQEFANKQKIQLRKSNVEDRIAIPLKELVDIAESTGHISQIAMEIEKALIRMKRLERDLAD